MEQPRMLNVDAEKLIGWGFWSFKPLKKFGKKEMRYIDNIWHQMTLTDEGLSPSDDCRYNDHDYDGPELCRMVATYGVRPGWYPIFWDYIEEMAAMKGVKGIDFKQNDEELLFLCHAIRSEHESEWRGKLHA